MKTKRIGALIFALGFFLAFSWAGQQSAEQLYKSGLYEEQVAGNLQKAIGIFQDILKRNPDNRAMAALAQLHIGLCYEKLGTREAEKAFQQVIDKYPEQAQAVQEAKEKLSRLRQARSVSEKGGQGLTVRHVMSWNDLGTNGCISPDGRYLVYMDWTEVVVVDLTSMKRRPLMEKGASAKSPGIGEFRALSPDNKTIAYGSYEQGLGLIGFDGSNPRVLCPNGPYAWFQPIEWSLDGKFVLVKATFKNGAADLGLISVADGSLQVLKSFPDRNLPLGNAFLSPDQRSVAYSCPSQNDSHTSDIYLLTLDDGRESPLVQNPAHDNLLGWLPDGGGILFASDRTGSTDAWVLPMAAEKPTGPPALVKHNIGTVLPIVLTRDGRFFFFTPGALRDIYSVPLDPQTARLAGPPAKEPLAFEGMNGWPVWSPDGSTLAYFSWRDRAWRESVLCLYSKSTKQVRELHFEKGFAYPRWSSDGHHLFVQATVADGQGIHQIDVRSGEVTEYLKAGEKRYLHAAQLAPDGRTFVYGEENRSAKTYRFMARDTETGQERELARTSFTNNTAALSPDGKHLAMILRREENMRALTVMDFPKGDSKDLLHFKVDGSFYIDLAWSPDGRYIYFSKPSSERLSWDLCRIPWEGGEGQNLGLTMRRFESLSINPDGRRITFASIPPDGEFPQVWVMENFLPPAPPAVVAPEKGSQEFTMRRVYDGAGLEWGNALSSDGRYLVYTDWATGDLAVMDLITKASRPLTKGGGLSGKTGEMGETSAFSPDDKRIAYGWYNKDKVPELWVIGSAGSAPRMLFRDEKSGWIRPHDWSPDGRQILAIDMKKDGPSQIVMVSVADGTVRVVRDVAWQDPDLDLSPDGRFIACTMGPDPSSSKHDIFIVKTDSGEINPLVTHDADDYSLGWAPDGKTLLFASDRSGSYGLWALDVSDGRAAGSPYLIKSAINKVEPVRLAPNGALYSVQTEEVVDLFTAAVDPLTGKVQGQPKAVPTHYTGANILAVWSPDGIRLAYLTRPGGLTGPNWPPVISILDVRTGEERQVAAKIGSMAPGQGFGWAPDGRSMLIIGRTGQQTAIYKVDLMSGAASPLVVIPKFQYTLNAAWSTDGKSIFYPQGNPTRILRRDLDTGKDSELAAMTGPAGIPTVSPSPDGKWLAFTSQDEGNRPVQIRIVPSAGGEVRELFRTAETGLVMDLNWTPDGRYLWFRSYIPSVDPKVPAKVESWRISPEGGDLQKLELDVRGGGVRLHPDGRQIVFMKGHGRRDLWVIENFLPADKAKK